MAQPVPLDPEPTSYRDAVTELESILEEIEDATVDIDVLATKVARAASLIEWCRNRLDAARTAIEDAGASLGN